MQTSNQLEVDKGVVKKVSGSFYTVEISKSDKCNGCKACAFGRNNKTQIKATCDFDCTVGDNVELIIPKNNRATLAYTFMYCVPIALMLIFAVIARITFAVGNDVLLLCAIIAGLFLGLAADYLANMLIEKRDARNGKLPKITKKI